MFKKYFIHLFPVLILSGCVTNDFDRIGEISNSDKIIVASIFKEELDIQKTGLTVINNEFTTLPIEDWKINSYIENSVINALPNKVVFQDNEIRHQLLNDDSRVR
ncbi:hypothetical protein L4D13_15790 [Photobacterium profundum]|uniref:hypothetical protein n=2 Tax=Photobacterium profundum TaxID=74109 RepID=UPI003D0EDBE7